MYFPCFNTVQLQLIYCENHPDLSNAILCTYSPSTPGHHIWLANWTTCGNNLLFSRHLTRHAWCNSSGVSIYGYGITNDAQQHFTSKVNVTLSNMMYNNFSGTLSSFVIQNGTPRDLSNITLSGKFVYMYIHSSS